MIPYKGGYNEGFEAYKKGLFKNPEEYKKWVNSNFLEMMEKNGFHVDREISAGSHHYGIIFKKL